MVGGEGGEGGEDGEGGEEGSEDVEQVTTGAWSCGARSGHGCVLTWSDLRSSHHHQHDATEANTRTTICVLQYYCTTVSNYQSVTSTDYTDHTK